jgi:beta-1,4-mannosyl-glycoprotein beta-1,4-N-acetylglucosaminyltransferase
MKVIDSFLFYNENDLLQYRINLLDKHVDYFIIVESTHTFVGKQKPMYLDKSILDNPKIIHIIDDQFPFKYPNIDISRNQQWQNEYHQRCMIRMGIDKLFLQGEDIILTSDVDEIPNPQIIQNIKNNSITYNTQKLNRLELDMYYYNLNYMVGNGANWHGIKLFNYNTLITMGISFQQIRLWEHSHDVPIIKNGGWHLSYFGDDLFIQTKLNSFSHQEHNNSNTVNAISNCITNGINLVGGLELRFIKIIDNSNLPPHYNSYKIFNASV